MSFLFYITDISYISEEIITHFIMYNNFHYCKLKYNLNILYLHNNYIVIEECYVFII